MTSQHDPTYYRRRVRDTLREARDRAELTQRQAADHLDWSLSKLVRIEAGAVGISTTDLQALLKLYKIDDPAQTSNLVAMARFGKRSPWFSKYQSVISSAFGEYLGYEGSASSIRGFQPLTIPGLLQTKDYARAIVLGSGAPDPDKIVELRMERQRLLERDQRPTIIYVIDEAALHREVGGPEVMRQQIRHLVDLLSGPRLSVRIIPFSAGAHPSMKGSFTILEFADWDNDLLYLETAGDNVTTRDDQELITQYQVNFSLLTDIALESEQSIKLLESRAAQYEASR